MTALEAPPLICYVDDSADYRLLLKHLLKHHCVPHSLATFADGASLLTALARFERAPDLIILDRHMPGLDGHQTLLQLKAQNRYRKIPVVMMSAQASSDEIDGCYEAGANSFLRKPVDIDQFTAELSLLCRYWLAINQRPSA